MAHIGLVSDWRSCWKWLSLHFIAAAAAFQGAVLAFPATLQQYLPDWLMHTLAIGLLVAAAAGRLIDQQGDGHGNVDK